MKRKLNYQNKKIAIIGGTFNPIHIGHLAIAQEAVDFKQLDEIIFIPAGVPPHKNKNIISGNKRLEMVKLAINNNEKFIFSDYEIKKSTKSYSIETVEYIQKIFKNCQLYFIMGEDSFMSIETWFRYEEFLKKVNVLVAKRSIGNIDLLREKISKFVNNGYCVEEIPAVFLDISSTYIREKIRNNKSAKYYLQEDVYNYIVEEGLYD